MKDGAGVVTLYMHWKRERESAASDTTSAIPPPAIKVLLLAKERDLAV